MTALKMYEDAQNLILQLGGAVDVENANRLNNLLTQLFVEDLEFAVNRHVETQLWKIIRSLIDSVSSAKETTKCNDNAVNMALSWLMQLSLRLHLVYLLSPNDLLPVMSLSNAITPSAGKSVTAATRKTILSFISFRIGDLMRYKNEYDTAERLYRIALDLSPETGDIWNQLGVLSRLRGNMIDAVYFGVRALHAPSAFPSASANISAVMRKYSTSSDPLPASPLATLFLVVLARFHFMVPVSDELILRLGPQLIEVRFLVPFLAIYSTLGATDDEKVLRGQIQRLLAYAVSSLSVKLESETVVDTALLSCLSLLVRVPAVGKPSKEALDRLCASDIELVNTDHIQFFGCLEDPLSYPVDLAQIVAAYSDQCHQQSKTEGTERERRHRRTVLVAPLPL